MRPDLDMLFNLPTKSNNQSSKATSFPDPGYIDTLPSNNEKSSGNIKIAKDNRDNASSLLDR